MAELVGAIGTGITVAQLAGQVASSIVQLKRLWSEFKEAPLDIQDYLAQVESANDILAHMQHDQDAAAREGRANNNMCMQRSLRYCKEGADQLGATVTDLSDKVKGMTGWRLKVGYFKIVLKKDDLRRLRERMKNAIDLLSLAYNFHTAAMIQAQPDIIVARLSAFVGRQEIEAADSKKTQSVSRDRRFPNSEDRASKNLIEKHYRHWASSPSWLIFLLGSFEYQSKHSNRRLLIHAKYRLPIWISNTVWECRGQKSLGGWQLNLKAYRILPFEHPLFRCARSGDVLGIQGLLSRREVSITDRQVWTGSTALHIAASRGHHEVCKILVAEGADVLSVDFHKGTPLHKTAETAGFVTFTGRGKAWEVSRLLVNAGAGHALIEDVDILERFEGPKGMLRYLLQQVYPPYYTLPIHKRFTIIEHLSSSDWHNTADLMRLAICNGAIGADMAVYIDPQGQTILHLVARSLANNMAVKYRADCETVLDEGFQSEDAMRKLDPSDDAHGARQLTREIISARADLHNINHKRQTPLCALIRDFTDVYCSKAFFFESLQHLLSNWLRDLFMSEVDLEKYGSMEKALHLSGIVESTFTFKKYTARRGEMKLIFTYGCRLDSWAFWFSEPTDLFAGEFWAMVERSAGLDHTCTSQRDQDTGRDLNCRIPGSWIDSGED